MTSSAHRIRDEVTRRLNEQHLQTEVDRRLTLIADFGEDPYANGDVVTFTKRFSPDPTAVLYRYAAVRVNEGRWYLTGDPMSRVQGVFWAEFVLWLVCEGEPTTTLTRMVPTSSDRPRLATTDVSPGAEALFDHMDRELDPGDPAATIKAVRDFATAIIAQHLPHQAPFGWHSLLTILDAAPAEPAVSLPWSATDSDGDRIEVRGLGSVGIYNPDGVNVGAVGLTATQRDEMIRALRAARPLAG